MHPALKVVISFWLLVIGLLITPLVLADDNNKAICTEKGVPVSGQDLAKCWNADAQTTFSLQGMMGASLGIMAGVNPFTKIPVRNVNPETGQMELSMMDKDPGGGALMGLAYITASLYNPPISSYEYLASIGENMGVSIKPAYAQQVTGSGDGVIRPVLKLWQVIRNLAYLVFIVIFIVIGFMIMFRQKISQQAVVTAQAALPGLVIGLLLVTFSYFIAALVVDLAFVGMKLVAEVFIRAVPNSMGSPDQLRTMADNSSLFELIGSAQGIVWQNSGDLSKAISDTAGFTNMSPALLIIPAIIGVIVALLLGPVGWLAAAAGVGGGLGLLVGLNIGTVIGTLISLILIIGLFIQMFKLLFSLLGTYIQILVATISGPFIILISSIPGKSSGIGGWLKGLVANALVFPAVFAAFLFAGLILATPNGDWKVSPPFFGGLTVDVLKFLLAYGILLGTPSIPDAVRGAFGIKPQQGGFMQAALAGFTGGASLGVGVARTPYENFWRGGAKSGQNPAGIIARRWYGEGGKDTGVRGRLGFGPKSS